jgi:hypothetical protein
LIVALGGFVILGLVTPTYNKADVLRGNEWVINYIVQSWEHEEQL